MSNLLSIKFYQPSPPQKRVPRPALTRKLNEGLDLGHPLTLISAPAGFGKTTCASEWLSGLALPVAWLALDADDNDPGRFFSYLFAALNKVGDKLGRVALPHIDELERVLAAGQLPPAEAIAGALIADLTETQGRQDRFLLVLDDFQVIQEPFILKVFEKLISVLFLSGLPQPLHLVLLTREDPPLPLARLRASSLLTEIRAADLRFSSAETGRFLNDLMGLDLAQDDLHTLEARTEGWIAGLQLAALALQGTLSIRGRSDPSGFIQGLSGSHRFILSYLTEEVLSRQTESVQQFLLDTSILDRLSGDLCDAVTGRTGSGALLEQLCSANLFLIPLDDEGRAYRYHHLFAGLLRSRQAALQGERTAELHRRASRWYARACAGCPPAERAALAGEAVRHALAAEDYAAAVQLIEEHVMDMLAQWYEKLVTGWMRALPSEWSARSPRASLAFARLHLMRGEFPLAAPYLQRLQALFSALQAGEGGEQITPALTAAWLALQSTLSSAQGHPSQALELAQQALAAAPEGDSRTLSQVYLALAAAYQRLDDPQRAEEAYQRLVRLGRASSDLVMELLGTSALALMMIERGRLRDAFELASQGAGRVERSGLLPPVCAGVYGELGVICSHWNQLDQAERYLQRAAQVSALGGSDAEVYYAVFRSRLSLIRGDLEGAAREIGRAAGILQSDAAAAVREEAIAQQVRVALAQEDPAAAEQALSSAVGRDLLPEFAPEKGLTYPQAVLYISGLRLLLGRSRLEAGGAEGFQLGLERAGQLLEVLLQRGYVPLALETLLLRAQFHAALGSVQAGLDDFSAALDLAEPEGYISPFLAEGRPAADALAGLLRRSQPGSARAGFIRTVLTAFPASQAAEGKPAELIEPLTDRELDVLRRIAEGRTYEETADQLVVSINTVRTHVKSLYGKLGVNNRTAAIAAARRLNLL